MAFFVTGNPPLTSTQTTATDPSTTTLVAELDSTTLITTQRGGIYLLNWWPGASTNAVWWLEHCLSTGLGSTAIRERQIIRTVTNQHAQYVRKFVLEANDRIRVRVGSTFTGDADVKLQAEKLE